MEKQLFIGKEAPQKELIGPVRNAFFVKADGGLWTSTCHEDGSSSWMKYHQQIWGLEGLSSWVLTVNPDAKILRIDSMEDLEKAYQSYGFLLGGLSPLLDYEKIAKDYDGIWLTTLGQILTRGTFPKFSRLNLYGWDVESTHWFRWVFDKVENLGELTIKK